jgi:hypothetical protein
MKKVKNRTRKEAYQPRKSKALSFTPMTGGGPMAWTKKGILLVGIVLAILIGIAIGLRYYIPYRIQTAIDQKVQSLRQKGYAISYAQLDVNWVSGTMSLKDLAIRKLNVDSGCQTKELFTSKSVRAAGFNIISVAFNDELNFTSVKFNDPHLVVKENTNFLPDSSQQGKAEFKLTSQELILWNTEVEYLDSLTCKPNSTVKSNFQIKNIELLWSADRPVKFTFGGAKAKQTTVNIPPMFYSFTIKQFDLDLANHELNIDSIKITPTLGKLKFGRTIGYESDRIAGFIPFLKLRGLKVDYTDTLVISTKHAALEMYLRVFRDKRLPFKKIEKRLPIQVLQQLAFGLSIDTLEIRKSFIEYEEFAEKSTTSGSVSFDDLNAVIYNINNDARETDGKTVMIARANLMGEADLRVRSEFPWNNSRKCLIEGTLQNLSLTKVNSLMQSVTNVKAESGKLKKLNFQFAYNSIRSDGKLELNYRDLKLITFKDDEVPKHVARKRREKLREVNKEENKLKSWIVNNFLIRKNVDEKDPEDERTGTIVFYRDIHRSIFNYWWKSLLSGLRSAFDLERFNDRDNRKNKKKQQQN